MLISGNESPCLVRLVRKDLPQARGAVQSKAPSAAFRTELHLRSCRFPCCGMQLLVVIWMGVTPIPVMGLLSPAGLRVFVVFLVIAGQVDSPGVVLVIIPVVVVLVVG